MLVIFLKKFFWRTSVLDACFGLLVTSVMGFKAGVGVPSLMFVIMLFFEKAHTVHICKKNYFTTYIL